MCHRLKDRGNAVLLISHSMPDVMQVSDRIIVLRHGKKVAELNTRDTSPEQVVGYIMGAQS